MTNDEEDFVRSSKTFRVRCTDVVKAHMVLVSDCMLRWYDQDEKGKETREGKKQKDRRIMRTAT